MFKAVRRKTWITGGLALAALLLGCNLVIIFLVRDENLRLVLSDIIYPLENLLATAALSLAAVATWRRSKRTGLAWGFLALAQLSYALGDVIWGILEAGLGLTPFPSISDGFYLAYYPLFLAGILLLPRPRVSKEEQLKKWLDIGIVMIGASLAFWIYLIGPLVAAGSEEPLLSQALTLAYPVCDLVLLWALVMLIYTRADERGETPVLVLAFGLALMIFTDCVFGYQTLVGTYTTGGIVDLGWVAVYFLTAWAAILQALSGSPAASDRLPNPNQVTAWKRVKPLLAYTPYAVITIAFAILVRSHYFPMPMDHFLLASGVETLIGLAIIRQVLMLKENAHLVGQLNSTLEQVQHQAAELKETNQELQVEILERKRAENQLAYDALHDGLTGLPNRVLFLDRLERAIAYTQRRSDYPFSVLFLDLDQFKVINDSLGHAAGDQLLVSIAGRLRDCLRSSDTVARLGGDEFVLLLENTTDEFGVHRVTRRIEEALRASHNLEGHEVYITASIGIVLSLQGYTNPNDVLRDADIAMYRAKALGKARCEIFNLELRTEAISRLELENDLRRAVERQEFQLYYQPIFSLDPPVLMGFEALIRWNHPERGLLLPGEFIHVAEESGIILQMGEWVLNEACGQMKKWREEFPDQSRLAINVNISGRQFIQPDFVDQIQKTLERVGLDAGALKLEITESVLIDSQARAGEVFTRLCELGVQLQIDDFGTGYSSLGYLQHYPVHTIKIDKSFVQEMGHGKKGTELIRAIVTMARDLGMETIAEGVETRDQLDELKSLSCQYGQGFLLSRPLDRMAAEGVIAGIAGLRTRVPWKLGVDSFGTI